MAIDFEQSIAHHNFVGQQIHSLKEVTYTAKKPSGRESCDCSCQYTQKNTMGVIAMKKLFAFLMLVLLFVNVSGPLVERNLNTYEPNPTTNPCVK